MLVSFFALKTIWLLWQSEIEGSAGAILSRSVCRGGKTERHLIYGKVCQYVLVTVKPSPRADLSMANRRPQIIVTVALCKSEFPFKSTVGNWGKDSAIPSSPCVVRLIIVAWRAINWIYNDAVAETAD